MLCVNWNCNDALSATKWLLFLCTLKTLSTSETTLDGLNDCNVTKQYTKYITHSEEDQNEFSYVSALRIIQCTCNDTGLITFFFSLFFLFYFYTRDQQDGSLLCL